jgi:uncharacterized metal-binding protein YceD (DUF177 family)
MSDNALLLAPRAKAGTPEGAFVLPIDSLKEGTYQLKIRLDNSFFRNVPHPEIQSADIQVEVQLQKTMVELVANMRFEGEMGLISDLSLQAFRLPIAFAHRIVYTSAKKTSTEADEVVYLQAGQTRLDLGQDFYDLIGLQVPFRKLSPEELDAPVPEDIAKYLMSESAENLAEIPDSSSEIDPRWAGLLKFKQSTDDTLN